METKEIKKFIEKAHKYNNSLGDFFDDKLIRFHRVPALRGDELFGDFVTNGSCFVSNHPLNIDEETFKLIIPINIYKSVNINDIEFEDNGIYYLTDSDTVNISKRCGYLVSAKLQNSNFKEFLRTKRGNFVNVTFIIDRNTDNVSFPFFALELIKRIFFDVKFIPISMNYNFFIYGLINASEKEFEFSLFYTMAKDDTFKINPLRIDEKYIPSIVACNYTNYTEDELFNFTNKGLKTK